MADLTLTVYDADDATPLFEVGTAKAHANPYLAWPEGLDSSEIDLLRGGASVGEVPVRVIDPQTGATKADRWLTSRLGVPTGQPGEGHSRLNGRRAVLQTVGGTLIQDGMISGLTLNDSFAGFTFALRDIRGRGQEIRVFTSAAIRSAGGAVTQAPAVFPRGRFGGYGRIAGTTPGLPDVVPARAFMRAGVAGGIFQGLDLRDTEWPASGPFPARLVVNPTMTEAVSRLDYRGWPNVVTTFADVRVLWRPVAGGAWTEVQVQTSAGEEPPPSLFAAETKSVLVHETSVGPVTTSKREDLPVLKRLYLNGTGIPAIDAEVEFVVVYVGEPSATWPFRFEGTAGEFLLGLYGGDFAERDPKIRHDVAAVTALKQRVRIAKFEPEDSLREVEEEFYAGIAGAPAVVAGLVTPALASMPRGSVVLPTVDENHAQAVPGWGHSLDGAVGVVVLEYDRDYLVPADVDPMAEQAGGDLLASTPVSYRYEAPQWALDLVGDKPHTIKGWMHRSIGAARGRAFTPDASSDDGARAALALGHLIVDRWLFGGQGSAVRVPAADFPTLKPGDWVVDARPWRPNYRTHLRGGDVIAQVVRLQRENDAWLDLYLLDGGPDVQPLAVPVVGVLTSTAEGIVTVPLTSVPAGADGRVDFAVAATEPAEDSDDWGFGGRRTGDGSVELPPVTAGVTVWVRARSEEFGRRPSDWTAATSHVIGSTPRVLSASVVVLEDGSARVEWDVNAATAGVRIHYEAHDPDATPTLPSSVDVDATLGEHTFAAITVALGQAFTVDVEPWTAFPIAGTAGARVRASDDHVLSKQTPTVDLTAVDTPQLPLTFGDPPETFYPTFVRLHTVLAAATKGLRVVITPDPDTGAGSATSDYGVSAAAREHSFMLKQPGGGTDQQIPRDNAKYTVQVTGYTDFQAGAVAGFAGRQVSVEISAPGRIDDPTDAQHPVTVAYADANYIAAVAWGSLAIVAGAVTPDFSVNKLLVVTLTQDVTMNLPSPIPGPGTYILLVRQSGGPWSITWAAAYEWPGGVAPGTGTKDVYTMLVDDLGVVFVAPALSVS